jgi:hypothetical protein
LGRPGFLLSTSAAAIGVGFRWSRISREGSRLGAIFFIRLCRGYQQCSNAAMWQCGNAEIQGFDNLDF